MMMKIKTIIYTATVLGASLCHTQSNAVYYGANSNALEVVFVDTHLSAANRAAIVTDLNLCLQSAWGKRGDLRLKDNEGFAGYLYFGYRCPHSNKLFPRDIVATPNGHALQISHELSDAYTNAFAFASAHSNIVAAGYAFVAFVSSTNFPNIPASELPHYFLPKNTPGAAIIANAQNTISELCSATYYPPSILGFGYMGRGPGPATTNLFMGIPSASQFGHWRGIPAIWHDGKWKFCGLAWFIDPPQPPLF